MVELDHELTSNVSAHVGYIRRWYGNFTLNARFDNGLLLSGGFDLGHTVEDRCSVVDSPEVLRHCKVTRGWGDQIQFKMMGVYPLPYDFQVSGNFQDIATVPTRARFPVTNDAAAPTLGRNLSRGSARVDLFAPYDEMLKSEAKSRNAAGQSGWRRSASRNSSTAARGCPTAVSACARL